MVSVETSPTAAQQDPDIFGFVPPLLMMQRYRERILRVKGFFGFLRRQSLPSAVISLLACCCFYRSIGTLIHSGFSLIELSSALDRLCFAR